MPSQSHFDLLIQRWQASKAQGQSITLEELCADHPDLLNQVRAHLESLSGSSLSISSPAETIAQGPASIARDGMTATLDSNMTVDVPHAREARLVRHQIPGYEILGELGRGGMGVVYKAQQTSLKRLVALKMVLAGDDAGAEQLARFRLEAESVAHLQHPNIVQIHEIGEHQGRPFFSLEFVDGGSLIQKIRGQLVPAQQAAQLTEILARAVQHAHQRGVVHRDLKPANILLQEAGDDKHGRNAPGACAIQDGYFIPKITDFGLAKRLESQDMGQTRSGAVMGTPSYMAPEQAEGRTNEIGPLVDVYALGAILYELITARPPFKGDSMMKTLHQVLHEDPPPPSKVVPKISRDLETICLKALAKDPAKRYQSALALAQDLERFLAGEPILARREWVVSRVWRKARRSPATAAAVIGLLLTAGIAAFAFLGASTTRQISTMQQAFETALDKEDWTPAQRHALEAMVAELEKLDPAQAAAARQRLHERFARSIVATLRQPRLTAEDMDAVKANVQWLATRDPDQGQHLAKMMQDRLREWQVVFDLKAPFEKLKDVFAADQVEPQGPVLALKGRDKSKAPRTDLVLPTRIASPGTAQMEAFFDASWDNAAQIGLTLNMQPGHLGTVQALAFSPDGKFLASAGSDRAIKIWEARTGKELVTLQTQGGAYGLAFSPDSQLLATGDGASVRLWAVPSFQAVAELKGHKETILSLTFSSGGIKLASGAHDKTVRIWDVTSKKEEKVLDDLGYPVAQVAYTPTADHLVIITRNRFIRVWDSKAQRYVQSWQPTAKTRGSGWALSADGQTILFDGAGRWLEYKVLTGKESRSFADASNAGQFFLGPDGKLLARANQGNIRVDPINNLRSDEYAVDSQASIVTGAFEPTGTTLALGLSNGNIVLWDIARHKPGLRLGGQGYAFVLAAGEADTAKPREAPAEAKTAGPATFQAARAAGAAFELRIVRNGEVQRSENIHVPPGPLHLVVRREADKLQVQVNEGKNLVFFDAFPLRVQEGAVFGLIWPEQARLMQLRGSIQGLPPVPSPLERGDDLYEKGHFGDALTLFQEQAVAAPNGEVKQEALCKAALCLVQLNRLDDAAEVFGPVVSEEGQRWPLLAASQLFVIRLQQNKFDDLEALRVSLANRFGFEQLAGHIPLHVRKSILRSIQVTTNDFLMPDRAQVHKLEQALALAALFQEKEFHLWSSLHLARLYFALGDEKKALALAKEHGQVENPAQITNAFGLVYQLRLSTWLMRRHGEALEALEILDKYLFESPGIYRTNQFLTHTKEQLPISHQEVHPCLPLLVDRARANIALKRFEQAEKDVDDLLRLFYDGSPNYQFWAAASLIKGFLRERRGDASGAAKAWKEGVYQRFLERAAPAVRAHLKDLPEGDGLLLHMVLGSLAASITDQEAEAILAALFARVGTSSILSQVASTIRVSPDIVRDMWRTPRGKELARKMAYLDLSQADYFHYPLYLTIVEKFKREAMTPPVVTVQEEIIWDNVVTLGDAFFAGEINKTHILQLALAYKGTTNFLGWGGVAPKLQPKQRAPIAYLLGHRSIRLDRPADALMYFRTAVADAPAETPLGRLAREELKKMEKK